jgi:hypothetical protein
MLTDKLRFSQDRIEKIPDFVRVVLVVIAEVASKLGHRCLGCWLDGLRHRQVMRML